MPVFSFRNIPVKINGTPFFVESLDFSSQASLSPSYKRNNKITKDIKAEDVINSSLKLSYPLTGTDALKNYTAYETGVISGDFAGYWFSNGYLKSYGLSVEPNTSLRANAEIVFFDSLSGKFTSSSVNAPLNTQILDGSNISFVSVTGIDLVNNNINSLDYNYSVDILPSVRSKQTSTNDCRFGRKIVQTRIILDSNSGFLPFSGERVKFYLNTKDRQGSIKNAYLIDGVVNDKQLLSKAEDTISTQYQITQYLAAELPYSTGFSPTSGYYFSTVNISGGNFSNISAISFNNIIETNFSSNYNNFLSVRVPENSTSGAMGFITSNNEYINIGTYNVLQSGMTINLVTPNSGSYYPNKDFILISGKGFYGVTDVLFGRSKSLNTAVSLDRNKVLAQIPENATYDLITILSSFRNSSGVSPSNFVPTPTFKYYEPVVPDAGNFYGYGNIGSFITMPSGYIRLYGTNLSGVTGLRINNQNVGIDVVSCGTGLPSNDFFQIRIPSGSYRGTFRLMCLSGVTKTSTFKFQPEVYISGIGSSPTNIVSNYSGVTGTTLWIKCINLVPEILSGPAANFWYVSFGNDITKYYFNNSTTAGNSSYMSGTIPTGASNGPISLYSDIGSKYTNTGVTLTAISSPEIYYFDNYNQSGGRYIKRTTYLGSNNFINLVGKNLNYVTGVEYALFSGGFYYNQGDFGNYRRLGSKVSDFSPVYRRMWTGWKINNDNTLITLPMTGSAYSLSGWDNTTQMTQETDFGVSFIGTGVFGLSGAMTEGLLILKLLSPYGNIDVYPGQFSNQGYPLSGAGFYNLPSPNLGSIGDYRASSLNFTLAKILNSQKVADSYNPSTMTGANGNQIIFSGATGIPFSESTSVNGYFVNSGVQTRYRNFAFIPTPYAYVAYYTLPAMSGWNWYGTGANAVSPTNNPSYTTSRQNIAGWNLPRSIYIPANKPGYGIYLQLSGSSLRSGINLFSYHLEAENGNAQNITGIVFGY